MTSSQIILHFETLFEASLQADQLGSPDQLFNKDKDVVIAMLQLALMFLLLQSAVFFHALVGMIKIGGMTTISLLPHGVVFIDG
jgi:hypothetical protein